MRFFSTLTDDYDRLNRETTEQNIDERGARRARRKTGRQALIKAVATLKEVKKLQKEQRISVAVINCICKKAEAEVRREEQVEVEQALAEAAQSIVDAVPGTDPGLLLDVRQKAEDLLKTRLDPQKRPQTVRDLKQAIQSLQAARPQP
jgi:hypothetical protein